MSHTVVHFEIPAEDPEKISSFYSDLFGWKIEKGQGPTEYWLVRTFAEGQQGVNGGIFRKDSPQLQPVNYIGVESVEEYSKRAEAVGGKVVFAKSPVPQQGWFAQLLDPEGNLFALWEDYPSAPMPERPL